MPITEYKNDTSLTGTGLAKSTMWNFVGQIVPLLLAFFCIPLLLRSLGIERFGILTLAWMITGYFSLFDLGLGRALTKLVAERLHTGTRADLDNLIRTGMLLMTALGAFGGLLFAAFSPALVHSLLKIPVPIQSEALASFLLLSISIPIVVSTAGLRGILEAEHRFGVANLARIPTAFFSFLGPVLVIRSHMTLTSVITVLVIGRMLSWILHFYLSVQNLKWYRGSTESFFQVTRLLLNFGGWMTVSNLISPIMVYFDRFMIGTLVSVAAVAYYATPFEMATKIWIIPNAIAGVLFPAFASTSRSNPQRTAYLFDRASTYLLLLTFPITLAIVTFAQKGLSLWLGQAFASHGTHVLQILAVGLFLNCISGHLTFCLLQAMGRPDLTAKLHVIELPIYVLFAWLLIFRFGVVGAALAWSLRVAVETVILMFMSARSLPETRRASARIALQAAVAFAFFGTGATLATLPTKIVFFVSVSLILALYTWHRLLTSQERLLVAHRFGFMETAHISLK